MRPTTTPARPLSGLVELLGLTGPATNARPAPRILSGGRIASESIGDVLVTGITHDSRQVRPGDLYAALPGSTAHGADFAGQAARAGAVAILTDPAGRDAAGQVGLPVLVVKDPRARLGKVAAWVYGEPADELMLIGVTGTSGKTTTVYLIDAGLRAAGHGTGLIGTVETKVGERRVPGGLTTPEATDLHAMFGYMRDSGVTAAAMEVSSHALEMGRAGGTCYDVAVFTNLSQDHLDFHTTMQEYFEAKARLFTPEFSRVGVVNLDDIYGQTLIDVAEIPVTTYSAAGDPSAQWRADDVRLGADGSTFRVVGPGGVEADVVVQIPGPFNVANALAAVVALVEAGVPLPTAVRGIGSLSGVPGRLERVDEGQDFVSLVDYSHKPGAVEAVLTALRPVTEGRLMVVLGCGGDRDRGKRPLMGEAAARLADVAVFTMDNPRSEDPLVILSAMMEGSLKVPRDQRGHVIVEPDRAGAIGLAVDRARRGDVVVVAGKGHEQGQRIGDEVLAFDDRDVVRQALRTRRPGPTGAACAPPTPAGADPSEQPSGDQRGER